MISYSRSIFKVMYIGRKDTAREKRDKSFIVTFSVNNSAEWLLENVLLKGFVSFLNLRVLKEN